MREVYEYVSENFMTAKINAKTGARLIQAIHNEMKTEVIEGFTFFKILNLLLYLFHKLGR